MTRVSFDLRASRPTGRRRRFLAFVALAALILLATATAGGGGRAASANSVFRLHATYAKAVSGNVIDVRLASGRHTLVHLIGVRETRPCECDPATWAPRADADQFLVRGARLLLSGDRYQPRRDAQGRLLAYVRATRPRIGVADLGKRLLEEGFVRLTAERFVRRRRYVTAERLARSEHNGTWSCPKTTAADVALTVEDRPDPVRIFEPLTFTATIENRGPGRATTVSLLASLLTMDIYALTWGEPGRRPDGTLAGTCTVENPPWRIMLAWSARLLCRADFLSAAQPWVITITGAPQGARFLGTVSSQFRVDSCSPDPDPSNNAVTVETSWLPPA